VLAHLLVALIAAVVKAVTVPLVGRLARRAGVLRRRAEVEGRTGDLVPTLGGLGMFAGFVVAMAVAWLLPNFRPLFTTTSEPLALLVGALVIAAVGLADDLIDLPPTVKLAGQVVAALGVALFGIQIVHFWLPGLEIVALSADLGLVLTVLALVAMVNAVNLIDGLDGLAAGVTAIGAGAFFLFTLRGQPAGLDDAAPTSATLVAAIVAGIALGFLVHNWHPARIFMGDTGSLLLGLLLGAASVSYVGRTTAPTSTDFFGSIPLLVPVLVLAIPFLDSAFAVARRALAGQPIGRGDHGHLHHLLLAFGHSHARAALVLLYWSAVLAFGSVGPAFLGIRQLLPWLVAAAALGVGLTVLGVRIPPADEPVIALADEPIDGPAGAEVGDATGARVASLRSRQPGVRRASDGDARVASQDHDASAVPRAEER
jgi:UDP-GlcNAc:undecaprenyl-phosphate/decaprenyl-phosphate GlcNAc-1-phosphate transferase